MSNRRPLCPRTVEQAEAEIMLTGMSPEAFDIDYLACDQERCDGPLREERRLLGVRLPLGKMVCGKTNELRLPAQEDSK